VNQEYVPWRFVALKRWLEQERLAQHSLLGAQLTLLALYGGLFILLSLPLLSWAAAIARAGLDLLGVALVIIFGYFMVYGVWGLVALNLWELRVETRHIAVRFLLGSLFLLTALLYLPLNSVAFLLAYLGGTDLGSPVSILGARPAPRTIHVLFHFLLLSCGIGLNRWLLRRKAVS
jgi:hypothetical protein